MYTNLLISFFIIYLFFICINLLARKEAMATKSEEVKEALKLRFKRTLIGFTNGYILGVIVAIFGMYKMEEINGNLGLEAVPLFFVPMAVGLVGTLFTKKSSN